MLLEEAVPTYHVSRTPCTLLAEDVTQRITYQQRLESYMKKMLQRRRNVFQVTWRRCHNVPGTSCKLIEEDVTTYRVSGTSCKLPEEALTTYQENLASYLEQDVAR